MNMNLRERLRKYFTEQQEPTPAAFTFSVASDSVENALAEKIAEALDRGVTEVATFVVQEFLYETEEGQALAQRMGELLKRFPALGHDDIEKAVTKAVLECFQRVS